MTTLETLRNKRDEIYAIANKYGVTDIRVFGSVVREEDTEDSDIDLLVNMEKGRDLFDLGGFQYDTEAFCKRRVDVVLANSIYYLLENIIVNEARPL